MSDSERTSAMDGVPTMTSPVSSRVIGGHMVDVSVAAFQIGGLLLLAYFHQLTIPAVYRVMGAACALACGGWFLSKRRPLKFAWSPAVADWRHNWRFAAGCWSVT